MAKTRPPDAFGATSLGEQAAIGRIHKALFGGDDRLVNVGRYEIRELIGSGAFGKVYRGRDPELDRDVAVKLMTADGGAQGDDDRAEMLREARVMAALGHPNVVAVHDAGVVEHTGRTRVFIVMELVTGHNLRRWAEQPHEPAAILDVLIQAGHGLAAAHAAGIIHRDFKPDNVLIGGDGRARVGDFGLARTHEPHPLDDGAIAGTPAYMAPEQLAGAPADARSDQFAFCVTAWEALAGARPFAGATIRELVDDMRRGRPPAPRRPFPARVQRALARGLSLDPAARFASADELLAELERPRPRWLVPAAIAVVAAVGVAVGAGVMHARAPGDADPCPRPTAELAGVWDDARRDAIERAFRATEASAPYQADTFARVAHRIDQATAAWLDASRDACLATAVRHDQSPELLDRRIACLRAWRRELRGATDAFATATAPVVEHAIATIAELPPLAACADRDAIAAGPGVPADPATRARLDVLLDQLAHAHAIAGGGAAGLAAATEQVDQVARDPLVGAHPPLAIALGLARAELATLANHPTDAADAQAAARAAFDAALGDGDRRSAASAALVLATLGATDTRRKADALQWVQTGRASIAKLDAAGELDAKLAVAEGSIEVRSADTDAAERAFRHAVEAFRTIDADQPAVGATLAMLGVSELGRGNLDAADRDLHDSLARGEAALGPNHPQLATALVDLALLDNTRGHYLDAEHWVDRAIAVVRAAYGDDHPMLIYAEGAGAQAAEMHGELATAERELRDARRIAAVAYGPSHPMGAQLALVLAEVLLAEHRPTATAEAVTLATDARALVATTADARDLGLAYADAILARATGALARAREAAARCAPVGDTMPAGPCSIVYQALGEVATDPAEVEHALAAAAHAIETGPPDPLRLAEIRFALARAELAHDRAGALALAATAEAAFPRDGDPAVRAALAAWRKRAQ